MGTIDSLVIDSQPSLNERAAFIEELNAALSGMGRGISWGEPSENTDEYSLEKTWRDSPNGLEVKLVDDGFLDVRFLLVYSFGEAKKTVTKKDKCLKVLRARLDVVSVDELVARYRAEPGQRTLGACMMGAARHPTAEQLELAREALTGGDDSLVETVAYSACFTNWPELTPDLWAAHEKQGPGEAKRWLGQCLNRGM